MPASRWRTGPRDGSRRPTGGGARSGRSGARTARNPALRSPDDLCTVTDEHGRVRHEFTADGPNQLWLIDTTEHKTAEGKLYLCAIKDVFGNKIVGYSSTPG